MNMLIDWLIGLSVVAAYITVAAYTFRAVYGNHRRRFIRRLLANKMWDYTVEKAVAKYSSHIDGRDDGLMLGWICGAFWPFAWLPAVFGPKITEWAERTMRKSAEELLAEARAELKELERENQDLDRQLAQYDKRHS